MLKIAKFSQLSTVLCFFRRSCECFVGMKIHRGQRKMYSLLDTISKTEISSVFKECAYNEVKRVKSNKSVNFFEHFVYV